MKGPLLMQGAISALHACQPYAMLPADRYGEWKVLDLSFTPQDFGASDRLKSFLLVRPSHRCNKIQRSCRMRPAPSVLETERPPARPALSIGSRREHRDEGHTASLVREGHGGRNRLLHLARSRLVGPLGLAAAGRYSERPGGQCQDRGLHPGRSALHGDRGGSPRPVQPQLLDHGRMRHPGRDRSPVGRDRRRAARSSNAAGYGTAGASAGRSHPSGSAN